MKNKSINILGVEIDNVDTPAVLEIINGYLSSQDSHYVVTPNPEILLQARKNEELFFILNNADLAISDGIGLKFAAWITGKNISRVTGADITKKLLAKASEKNLKVLIVNWRGGLSVKSEILLGLKKTYPGIKLIVEDIDRQGRIFNVDKINQFAPQIMLVTLGAPWQEKFIYQYYRKIRGLKVSLGVGQSIDFAINKVRRAPAGFRLIGLEWLWRLLRQPKRAGRIFSAVFKFPGAFIKWRFIYPFLYRPNVACLLYKKEDGNFKILLVERTDMPGHWQIPQGGCDAESIAVAGKRELREEIGTDKFVAKGVYKNLYRYKFGTRVGESRVMAVASRKHTGYKGQIQSLYLAKYIGLDSDISIRYWDHKNWKWVDVKKAYRSVNYVRQEAMKIYLHKFNKYIKKYEN